MMLNLIIYGALLVFVGCNASAGTKVDTRNVSQIITKYSAKYNVEREVLSCVLRIESNYRMGIISTTQDYGMAQINLKTAKRYKFDVAKLLGSADYAVAAAAQVLSDYRTAFKGYEGASWVARYNIGYQSLSYGTVGSYYVAYNAKVATCIASGTYL